MNRLLTYDQEQEDFLTRSLRIRECRSCNADKDYSCTPTEFKVIGNSYKFPPNHYELKELNSITLRDLITDEEVIIWEDENQLFQNIKVATKGTTELIGKEVTLHTVYNSSPWYFSLTEEVAIL